MSRADRVILLSDPEGNIVARVATTPPKPQVIEAEEPAASLLKAALDWLGGRAIPARKTIERPGFVEGTIREYLMVPVEPGDPDYPDALAHGLRMHPHFDPWQVTVGAR